jgi:hypothetical protein
VQGCSTSDSGRHVGVVGNTGSGAGSAGVAGYANGGCCRNENVTAGVYGQSEAYFGQGVSGVANPVAGCGGGVGVIGKSNGLCGIGVKGVAGTSCTVPIVASGPACQVANLQEWEKGSSTVSVVNACGWLGLGRSTAPTTLAVAGSISANVATPCAAYPMSNTDFAIFAKGNVTLVAASTRGMIVFIKNISTGSIKVTPVGSDLIDGKNSETLSKKYDSLTLVSDGNSPGNWYIQSNAK